MFLQKWLVVMGNEWYLLIKTLIWSKSTIFIRIRNKILSIWIHMKEFVFSNICFYTTSESYFNNLTWILINCPIKTFHSIEKEHEFRNVILWHHKWERNTYIKNFIILRSPDISQIFVNAMTFLIHTNLFMV